MKIVSVNIGEKRKVTWRNKIVETGIFKFPVQNPIFLDIEDVKNDFDQSKGFSNFQKRHHESRQHVQVKNPT